MALSDDMLAREAARRAAERQRLMFWGGGALAVVALLITIGALLGSYFIVDQGERAVVTRTGAIARIEQPGLHFKLPFVESVYHFNLRSDHVDVNNAEGATHDSQPVHTSLVVRYELDPAHIEDIFTQYDREGDMDRYVQSAILEVFKAITARYTAPELLDKRSEVSIAVTDLMQAKMNKYGVHVVAIDMTGFSFQPSYMQSINAKVQAEQDVLTQQQIVLRNKAQQQDKVNAAQAEADATRLKADADAYQVTANAKARATALTVEAQALAQNQQILELRRIEVDMEKARRWSGTLPQAVYGSAPIPFLNVTGGK